MKNRHSETGGDFFILQKVREAGCDELENYGLIEAGSYKRQVFLVTHIGYQVADEVKKKLEIDFNNSPDQYLAEN